MRVFSIVFFAVVLELSITQALPKPQYENGHGENSETNLGTATGDNKYLNGLLRDRVTTLNALNHNLNTFIKHMIEFAYAFESSQTILGTQSRRSLLDIRNFLEIRELLYNLSQVVKSLATVISNACDDTLAAFYYLLVDPGIDFSRLLEEIIQALLSSLNFLPKYLTEGFIQELDN